MLAREAQAAKKHLLKLRADTKKAIDAAKREVAQAVEAAKSAFFQFACSAIEQRRWKTARKRSPSGNISRSTQGPEA